MEEIVTDLEEEILFKLKEINFILEKIKKQKENFCECSFAHSCKHRIERLENGKE